ncbi:Uncharacterised protein [Vibrio cholerae]|nr:Uncharacterised protein [Vibrio cholerae]
MCQPRGNWHTTGWIHTHVEWTIFHKTKTALGIIQLR